MVPLQFATVICQCIVSLQTVVFMNQCVYFLISLDFLGPIKENLIEKIIEIVGCLLIQFPLLSIQKDLDN